MIFLCIKTFKRTIANISHWPDKKINSLRAVLQNKNLVDRDELFSIKKTTPHGHVKAILGTIKKLNLDKIISSKPCRERDLVIAMIAERLIHPCSKLATARILNSTILAEELSIESADEEDLYDAMDWLLKRQSRIENKLAKSHISDNSLVLYDVSSSYYEGHTCPLIAFGHNKDKKEGKKIIVYRVMTDHEGRPVSVDVYSGDTGDSSTVEDRVRSHIFICMLTYYVEWHMHKALVPLLFDDEELDTNRKKREPVKPAVASASAKRKKKVRKTKDGLPIHSFDTLMVEMGTLCKTKCELKSSPSAEFFYQETEMSPLQEKSFNLLGL